MRWLRRRWLLLWFLTVDTLWFVQWASLGAAAGNVRTYHAATQVWLSGGDPWAQSYPTPFGEQWLISPPPGLVPYALTSRLPVEAAMVVWVAIAAIAAVWVVRRIGLPLWWLAFPPLAFDVFWGSVDVLALAVVLGPLAWLGAAVKPTVGGAIIADRRWRQLVGVGLALAASVAVLPWGTYLGHARDLAQRGLDQSHGGYSAAGLPWLAARTARALVSHGWRRGWYLAGPARHPARQVG